MNQRSVLRGFGAEPYCQQMPDKFIRMPSMSYTRVIITREPVQARRRRGHCEKITLAFDTKQQKNYTQSIELTYERMNQGALPCHTGRTCSEHHGKGVKQRVLWRCQPTSVCFSNDSVQCVVGAVGGKSFGELERRPVNENWHDLKIG